MGKKIILIITAAAVAATGIIFMAAPERLLGVLGGTGKITIVVDPGHGGIDGGAESRGGVCEKDINLSIGMKIKEIAEEEGWRVLMTRDRDEGLYSEDKGSIRSKKSEDLKKRQEIINNSGADAAVSIHLNSYPSSGVKGAQTFYPATSEEGRLIAETIQKKIKEKLDRDNDRTSLPKDDIIIMKNNTSPLVLLECGFLSNDEEAARLVKKEYQDRIAALVVEAFKEYFIHTGKIEKQEVSVVFSK
ncbi:MAG: N-acetylmuramoyl-L-alanine amidase CwlD [Bacillota bacterium]|nr:N-acetylmuramoyl-L-alanine amidase CwlD [Bacillota bacterium]